MEPQPGCFSSTNSTEINSLEFLKTFDIIKPLGAGSFGVVYQVRKKHFGDRRDVIKFPNCGTPEPILEVDFAIKIIPEGRASEANFIASLYHPHIMCCYTVWPENGTSNDFKNLKEIKEMLDEIKKKKILNSSQIDDNQPVIVGYVIPPFLIMQLELCTEGSMDKYFEKTRKFSEFREDPYRYCPETKNLFAQILEALVFMEMKSIVHGDLKPNNVFLTRRNENVLIAKIGDFGLTSPKMVFTVGKEHKALSRDYLTEEVSESDMEAIIDDRRFYLSPEQAKIFQYKKTHVGATGANHKSDIYSLGLILIPMLIQFESVDKLADCIFWAMLPEKNRKFPPELQEHFNNEFTWIQKMLNHDFKLRPSASKLKEHLTQVPGYEIQYGAVSSRLKILNMFNTFEFLLEKELEDLDGTLKGTKCRLFYYLIEIIHEALISLAPDDEIILEAFNHLKNYPDHPASSRPVVLYWLRKFVPLLEAKNGLENFETIKWLYIFAAHELEGSSEKFVQIVNRVRNSVTFQDLDLLHSFRLKVDMFLIMVRCGSEYKNYSERSDNDLVNFSSRDELAEVLQKSKNMYSAMTNILELDHLEHPQANAMFILLTKLLTQSGLIQEAEEMFQGILYSEEMERMDLIKISYCKFLGFQNRHEEAIKLMKEIYKKCEAKGDQEGSRSALLHLTELFYNSDNECLENNEWIKTAFENLFRKSAVSEGSSLLLNPTQLQFDEVNFKARFFEFDIIE